MMIWVTRACGADAQASIAATATAKDGPSNSRRSFAFIVNSFSEIEIRLGCLRMRPPTSSRPFQHLLHDGPARSKHDSSAGPRPRRPPRLLGLRFRRRQGRVRRSPVQRFERHRLRLHLLGQGRPATETCRALQPHRSWSYASGIRRHGFPTVAFSGVRPFVSLRSPRKGACVRALPLIPVVFLACAGQQRSSESPKTASQPNSPTAPGGTVHSLAKGALLLEGLGTLHRPISTSSAEAQAFFDQGLRLAYGFNHDEAARSFARAAVVDSQCAMCFWGVSLTLGPNYNVPMLADRAHAAWDALARARELASRGTPIEQALIAALAKRYQGPEPLDPSAQQPFNEAYAKAMREVAHAFPIDLDPQVLFAEALMDVDPWRLWTLDGKPAPQTEETVATLENVLARDPDHPGANHYYIHAVEASLHPEKAIASADRLGELMPGAGHVVHMPAHIYQSGGRCADATEVNRKAVEVDHRYLR